MAENIYLEFSVETMEEVIDGLTKVKKALNNSSFKLKKSLYTLKTSSKGASTDSYEVVFLEKIEEEIENIDKSIIFVDSYLNKINAWILSVRELGISDPQKIFILDTEEYNDQLLRILKLTENDHIKKIVNVDKGFLNWEQQMCRKFDEAHTPLGYLDEIGENVFTLGGNARREKKIREAFDKNKAIVHGASSYIKDNIKTTDLNYQVKECNNFLKDALGLNKMDALVETFVDSISYGTVDGTDMGNGLFINLGKIGNDGVAIIVHDLKAIVKVAEDLFNDSMNEVLDEITFYLSALDDPERSEFIDVILGELNKELEKLISEMVNEFFKEEHGNFSQLLEEYQTLIKVIYIMNIISENVPKLMHFENPAPGVMEECEITDIELVEENGETTLVIKYSSIPSGNYFYESYDIDFSFSSVEILTDFLEESYTNSISDARDMILGFAPLFITSPALALGVDIALGVMDTLEGLENINDEENRMVLYALGCYIDPEGNMVIDTAQMIIVCTLFGNDIVIDSGQSFLEWGEQEYIVSTPPPPFYGDIKKDMGDTADDGISNQEYLTACKEYYEKQT